ncbi:CorA family divalent cation transporter [Sulfurimonas sp. HSL3-7]|uniref:CorA family divalent cation transporter n=1 Tax=Sulfonitrofixus jiaomeiensis TaxID=3131938 RepID=UPI0031F87EA1
MEHLEQLIDTLHLEDLRNELHPSIFDENETYNMLIVRLPVIGKELQVISLGFVITPEKSYFYDKEEKRFKLLEERFEGPYGLIDRVTDQMLKSFTRYQDLIAAMEEKLYTDKASNDFMTEWLGLKRDILRIERVLVRALDTMKEVIDAYEEAPGFPINSYADLYEHIDRTMRSAALQLSKLDYLYNFYNIRTNEKMNRLIYTLTIISAVFLPLNLAVGFFGMNTSGLPFTGGSSGTLNAVLLMGALILMSSAIFYLWRSKVEKS